MYLRFGLRSSGFTMPGHLVAVIEAAFRLRIQKISQASCGTMYNKIICLVRKKLHC
jgi:hypothetical protein